MQERCTPFQQNNYFASFPLKWKPRIQKGKYCHIHFTRVPDGSEWMDQTYLRSLRDTYQLMLLNYWCTLKWGECYSFSFPKQTFITTCEPNISVVTRSQKARPVKPMNAITKCSRIYFSPVPDKKNRIRKVWKISRRTTNEHAVAFKTNLSGGLCYIKSL